jgi:hypothetical protein
MAIGALVAYEPLWSDLLSEKSRNHPARALKLCEAGKIKDEAAFDRLVDRMKQCTEMKNHYPRTASEEFSGQVALLVGCAVLVLSSNGDQQALDYLHSTCIQVAGYFDGIFGKSFAAGKVTRAVRERRPPGWFETQELARQASLIERSATRPSTKVVREILDCRPIPMFELAIKEFRSKFD